MKRAYDNRARALAAAETRERLIDATESLIAESDLADLTLAAIAERAGVSVQTVLRHAGSRDGCLQAVAERVRERIAVQRGGSPAGDIDAGLDELMAHYEAEGRLTLRLLGQEARDPEAAAAVAEGRAFHRAWVLRCFGPYLRPEDTLTVDALVGATDLYLWKLYRLDLGRSAPETRAVLKRLVRALLEP